MKNLFTDVEYKIASIFFAIMLVLVLLSIGMRLFGGGLVWAEELARYAVVWGVCLGIIGGVKARHHIFIDFIIDRFPRKISFGFKLFDDIVDFCIYLFVSYYAFQFVSKTIDTGQLTPSLQWPMWVIYLAMPLCFFVSAIRQLINTVHTAKTFKEQLAPADDSATSKEKAV